MREGSKKKESWDSESKKPIHEQGKWNPRITMKGNPRIAAVQ